MGIEEYVRNSMLSFVVVSGHIFMWSRNPGIAFDAGTLRIVTAPNEKSEVFLVRSRIMMKLIL